MIAIMKKTKKNNWQADTASAVCPNCQQLVRTRTSPRTVTLNRTQLQVQNVLVDECPSCGAAISVSRQALAQFREAGVPK
jgi:YgiT-type zinc finger domain-containing protein